MLKWGRVARGLGESLDRKHLWGPGGAANERKFQKSPRDKLFMSINFIYVDWDLLQLSVFSYTHRSCLPNILQKNSFVKPCLQMPSCTCFPAAPVGAASQNRSALGAVFPAAWFTKHLHQSAWWSCLKHSVANCTVGLLNQNSWVWSLGIWSL